MPTETFPWLGGIATYFHHLIRGLARQGVRITLLTGTECGDGGIYAAEPGVEIVNLRTTVAEVAVRIIGHHPALGRREAELIAFGIAVRGWLIENAPARKIDLIEAPDHGGLAAFLADSRIPPTVVSTHGTTQEIRAVEANMRAPNFRFLPTLERESLLVGGAVFCGTPAKAAALGRDGIENASYLPPPFILDQAPPSADRRCDFITTMTVVARLQVCKGPLLLAEALRAAGTRRGDIFVDWYGGDTQSIEGSVAQRIASTYPDVWGGRFVWRGPLQRDQVGRVLRGAQAVIIPSTYDAFNYVQLEAMNVARPLVVSTGVGAHCLLRHEHDALLFDPVREDALAGHLERLSRDRATRDRLGQNAHATLRTIYEGPTIWTTRIAQYRRVLANNNAARGHAPEAERLVACSTRRPALSASRWMTRLHPSRLAGGIYRRLHKLTIRRKASTDKHSSAAAPHDVFEHIYRESRWESIESKSGPGSELRYTVRIRTGLEQLIRQLGIRSLLDVPCGDLNWIQHLLPRIDHYVGGDIVPEIIDAGRAKFAGTPKVEIRRLNIVSDKLPPADLLLCRDCLVHLPTASVRSALANIRRSAVRYVALTHFPEISPNADIGAGGWRPLNLEEAPFLLPPAQFYLDDNYTPGPSKCIGVWAREDLPDATAPSR